MRQISERSSAPRGSRIGRWSGPLDVCRNFSCGIQRSSTTMRPRPRSSSPVRPTCSATASPAAAAVVSGLMNASDSSPRRVAGRLRLLCWPKSRCFAAEPPKRLALLEDGNAAKAGEAALAAIAGLYRRRETGQGPRFAAGDVGGAFSARPAATATGKLVQSCIHFQRLVARHLARYRERRMDDVLKQTVEQLDAFLACASRGTAADDVSCVHLPCRGPCGAGSRDSTSWWARVAARRPGCTIAGRLRRSRLLCAAWQPNGTSLRN